MPLTGGIQVGEVYAKAGARVDESGFNEFERELARARADAAKGAKADLTADVDSRHFAAYHAELDKARTRAARQSAYKAKLGADFDPQAFAAAERHYNAYDRQTRQLTGSTNRLGRALKDILPTLSFTTRIPVYRIAAIAGAIASIIAPTVALGGALGPVAGLLAALPGLAATGIGALVAGSLGMRGIGDAVKATWQANTDAAVNSTKASTDFGDAQADAARKVRDLRAEVERSALTQAGANLQLRRARQELGETQASGVGGLELAEARQRVAEAEEAVDDSRREAKNSTEDLARAERDATTAGEDLSGAQETVAKKMHDLSPAGQEFVGFVERRLFPVVRRLQGIAQQGLLPGLQAGTEEALHNLPIVEQIIRRYSNTLGDAAERQGRFLGQKSTGRDLASIFGAGDRLLKQAADDSTLWEQALIHVAVAAEPLLDWAGRMDHRLATLANRWAEQGRESGRLERFFDRAAHNTELFVDALWQGGRALINIGSIGRRVWGQDMLEGIDKAARRFRQWTESVRGEREITAWFRRWRQRWADVVDEIDRILDRYRELRTEGKSVAEASAQALTEAFGRALPGIAEGAARIAPTVALAFITGFLDSDAWGKLAIGAWLLTKFGGLGAVRGLGADIAGALSGGMGGGKGGGLLGKVSGLLAGRGNTPAQPLYVFDVNPKSGGGLGDLVKTGGKAGGALSLLRVVAAGGGAAGVILAPLFIADKLQKGGLQPAGGRDPATGAPLGPAGKTGFTASDQYAEIQTRKLRRFREETESLVRSLKDVGAGLSDAFQRSKGAQIDRQADRVKTLREELSHLGHGTDDYRTKADELRDAQRKLNRMVDDARPAAKHAGRGFAGLSANVIQVGIDLGLVGTYVVNATNTILKEFGAKRIEHSVTKFHAGQRGPGFSTNQSGGLHQFGGRDESGPDSMFGQIGGFNVAVAPGEVAAVMTRHHRRAMDSVFAPIGGLEGFMDAFSRPHSAPMGFQAGGLTGPHGTGEGFIPLTNFLARRFDLTMTAGRTDHALRTVDGNVSRHSVGAAGDYSNGTSPTPQMDAAARLLSRVLGHTTFKPGSNSGPPALHQLLYRTLIGGNHFNHVHVDLEDMFAFSSDRMAALLGGGDTKVHRLKIGGGTATTRDILQAAADTLVKGANRKLRRELAEELAPGAVGRGGTDTGIQHGDGDVESEFAKTARKLSTSKIATLALGMAGYAESGMEDLDYGDSSSLGSLQLLASTAAALGVSPHDEGAVSSLFLLRGFAGAGGANALAAKGLPAHLVAQGVQGSAFSDGSNYAAQEGNARAWMKRYKLARGALAYVGDSLGQGTLAGGLRGKLGDIRLFADALQSRTSSAGVGVLRTLLRGHKGTDGGIFDLGTNDATAASLRGSIGTVEEMLGGRPLIMATVSPATPDARAKNQLIRNRADQVVDWGAVASSFTGTDGIHPTAAGYRRRAQMVANVARRAGKSKRHRRGRSLPGISAGWLNDLLTSGSSPADIAAQIADQLSLYDTSSSATWKPIGVTVKGGTMHLQGGGLVGSGGDLTGKGTRRAGHLGQAVRKIRGRIEGLGHKYELDSRRFDLSEEEFVIEGDEDTPPQLNMEAINRRSVELTSLIKTRRAMAMQYKKLVEYLTKLNRLWRTIEGRLQQSLGNARARLKKLGKGKEADRTRDTLIGRIRKWTERLQGVRGSLATGVQEREDASFDWQSTRIDVDELRGELAPLLGGGKGVELPEWEPTTPDAADTGADQATQLQLEAEQRLNKTLSGFLASFGGPGDIAQSGFVTAQGAAANPTGVPPSGTPGAWFGGGGPGGPPMVYLHQEVNTLHPGDPEVHRALAGAAVQGIQGQAFRESNRERSQL